MEEREVLRHVDGTSQAFRDRVNGGDIGKVGGLWAWPCDMALYALKTDVLIVLIDTQRMSAKSTLEHDEVKACEELWFDSLVESPKKRVACFLVHKDHFQLGVVRTPALRCIFERGPDWDHARRLILTFIKQRIPDLALAPIWQPPGHVFGNLLKSDTSVAPPSRHPLAPGASLDVKSTAQLGGERKSERMSVREVREKGGNDVDVFVCQTAAQSRHSGKAQAQQNLRTKISALPRSDSTATGAASACSVAGVSSSSSKSGSLTR
jgi:hypothetical protein